MKLGRLMTEHIDPQFAGGKMIHRSISSRDPADLNLAFI